MKFIIQEIENGPINWFCSEGSYQQTIKGIACDKNRTEFKIEINSPVPITKSMSFYEREYEIEITITEKELTPRTKITTYL